MIEKEKQVFAIDKNWNILREFSSIHSACEWANENENKFFQILARSNSKAPILVIREGKCRDE